MESDDLLPGSKTDAIVTGDGKRAAIVRTLGDWNWTGTFDSATFAAMTDQDMQAEGWPI